MRRDESTQQRAPAQRARQALPGAGGRGRTHHWTPSVSGLLAQSSSGAKAARNGGLISSEKPSISWHWIESPMVIVASKSVMTSS